MIEKQKYRHLVKSEAGYNLGEIYDEYEIPYEKGEDLYVPIPNLELWDESGAGFNKTIQNNQIEYLKKHCLFELRRTQSWKFHRIHNNLVIAITPDNVLFTYCFSRGIVVDGGFRLDMEVQKNIVQNYLNNSRLR